MLQPPTSKVLEKEVDNEADKEPNCTPQEEALDHQTNACVVEDATQAHSEGIQMTQYPAVLTTCDHTPCGQLHDAELSHTQTVWLGSKEQTFYFCSTLCRLDFYRARLRVES
jgi:hypothetical protein